MRLPLLVAPAPAAELLTQLLDWLLTHLLDWPGCSPHCPHPAGTTQAKPSPAQRHTPSQRTDRMLRFISVSPAGVMPQRSATRIMRRRCLASSLGLMLSAATAVSGKKICHASLSCSQATSTQLVPRLKWQGYNGKVTMAWLDAIALCVVVDVYAKSSTPPDTLVMKSDTGLSSCTGPFLLMRYLMVLPTAAVLRAGISSSCGDPVRAMLLLLLGAVAASAATLHARTRPRWGSCSRLLLLLVGTHRCWACVRVLTGVQGGLLGEFV